jgi:hypothetical protein
MHLIGDGKNMKFSKKNNERKLLHISENMRDSLMKLCGIVNQLFFAKDLKGNKNNMDWNITFVIWKSVHLLS